MSLAVIFFVSPKPIEPLIVAISYLFAGGILIFLPKLKCNKALRFIIFFIGASLIFFSWIIWAGDITFPNNFLNGFGYLLFGLILFLSHHKKLASAVA